MRSNMQEKETYNETQMRNKLYDALIDDLRLAKQLLKNNSIDLEWSDSNNKTRLLHFMAYCDNSDAVHLLLQFGADPNAKNKNGETPLHWACRMRSINSALHLLEYKADVNIKDISGSTPLHCACSYGIPEVIPLLLAYGSDIYATDNDGKTASQLANEGKGSEYLAVAVLLKRATIKKQLLKEDKGINKEFKTLLDNKDQKHDTQNTNDVQITSNLTLEDINSNNGITAPFKNNPEPPELQVNLQDHRRKSDFIAFRQSSSKSLLDRSPTTPTSVTGTATATPHPLSLDQSTTTSMPSHHKSNTISLTDNKAKSPPTATSTVSTAHTPKPKLLINNTDTKKYSPTHTIKSHHSEKTSQIADQFSKSTSTVLIAAPTTTGATKSNGSDSIPFHDDYPLKFRPAVFVPLTPHFTQPHDVIISIERCADCHLHGMSLRHEEKQYRDVSNELLRGVLQMVINEKFPIRVYGVVTKADHTRLGALELTIAIRKNTSNTSNTIFNSNTNNSIDNTRHQLLAASSNSTSSTNATLRFSTSDNPMVPNASATGAKLAAGNSGGESQSYPALVDRDRETAGLYVTYTAYSKLSNRSWPKLAQVLYKARRFLRTVAADSEPGPAPAPAKRKVREVAVDSNNEASIRERALTSLYQWDQSVLSQGEAGGGGQFIDESMLRQLNDCSDISNAPELYSFFSKYLVCDSRPENISLSMK